MDNRSIRYFVLPKGDTVAMICKSGSSAIASALLKEAYPEKMPRMYGAVTTNKAGLQQFVPTTKTPCTAPIIPVRHPVERFKSACAFSAQSVTRHGGVDGVLDALEKGWAGDPHFWKTSSYLKEGCRLFLFPEHLGELTRAIGVTELPVYNDSIRLGLIKPDLNKEQIKRVLSVYALDSELFQSIDNAGKLWLSN